MLWSYTTSTNLPLILLPTDTIGYLSPSFNWKPVLRTTLLVESKVSSYFLYSFIQENVRTDYLRLTEWNLQKTGLVLVIVLWRDLDPGLKRIGSVSGVKIPRSGSIHIEEMFLEIFPSNQTKNKWKWRKKH